MTAIRNTAAAAIAIFDNLDELGIVLLGACAGRIVVRDSHCRWIVDLRKAIAALDADDDTADINDRFQLFCDRSGRVDDSTITARQLAALRRAADIEAGETITSL